MSKSILIRVTNDEGYDDVAPELMMEDVIGNPAGGWAFELVQEVAVPMEALQRLQRYSFAEAGGEWVRYEDLASLFAAGSDEGKKG